MFKIAAPKEFWLPISLDVLGDKRPQTMEILFEYISGKNFTEFMASHENDADIDGLIIRRFAKDWREVADDDGRPLEFSKERLETVMERIDIKKQIAGEFVKAIYGARLKN